MNLPDIATALRTATKDERERLANELGFHGETLSKALVKLANNGAPPYERIGYVESAIAGILGVKLPPAL